jgi:hypothetical protein
MIIKFYNSFLLLLFFNRLRIIITTIGATIDGSSNKDNKVYCQSIDGRPVNYYRPGTSYPGIITESDDGNGKQRIWSTDS